MREEHAAAAITATNVARDRAGACDRARGARAALRRASLRLRARRACRACKRANHNFAHTLEKRPLGKDGCIAARRDATRPARNCLTKATAPPCARAPPKCGTLLSGVTRSSTCASCAHSGVGAAARRRGVLTTAAALCFRRIAVPRLNLSRRTCRRLMYHIYTGRSAILRRGCPPSGVACAAKAGLSRWRPRPRA